MYWGVPWCREVVHFRLRLEEQYQKGIAIEQGELIWPSYDGKDVVTHYYTHDRSRKPWYRESQRGSGRVERGSDRLREAHTYICM